MYNSVLFGFHCYHELGKEDLSKEKEFLTYAQEEKDVMK